MIHFGVVRPGSTLRIPFDTFAAATGAPAALTNFAVGDILIYKDGNTTARASTTGYTATTSFSTITGINEAVIDLSSDATADFFKAGSNYVVVISPVTADGQTLAFVAATFTIGYPDAILNTSIATLTSQTSFTLTTGPAEDDALNGLWCLIHDKASAVQATWAIVLDYTGATKTVTLAAVPAVTFVIAAIDNISFFGPAPLQPATIGAKLVVGTDGAADTNVTKWLGTVAATPTVAGVPEVDVTHLGGVAQSAADLKDFADEGYDPATNKVQGVVLVDTLTTYTSNTPQTGDSFARLGAPAGVSVSADIAAIEAQTDDIGVAGAGLTALGDVRLANLDATISSRATQVSVDDLPTNAELSAALAASDDAVLAAIAALNNLAAGAAMTLTVGERDAIANALLDLTNAIETGLTLRNAQRLQSAAAAGKLSGAAATPVVIRNAIADTKDRITATVDADGNRSAVVVDLT